MRVLVVEDDRELGIEVARGLRSVGYAVDLAATVAAADLKLAVNGYDCLVLDRILPDGDGLGLLRARRAEQPRLTVVRVVDLELDTARKRVRRDGVVLSLGAKEFAVLEMLVVRAGEVVSRTELIDHCWDELTEPMSNVVDAVIAQLRRKLGPPGLIDTVRGAGYVIDESPAP